MRVQDNFAVPAIAAGLLLGLYGGQTTHTLLPGDVALGYQGDVLETLLGSCVSVILTDPRRTTGVMCHIVHCLKPPAEAVNNTAYAVHAMPRLFAMLRNVGIAPELCEAYVYGGGSMFPDVFSTHHVGKSNVAWTLDFLESQGIPVVEQSVGDAFYRKVRWTVGPQNPKVIETGTQVPNDRRLFERQHGSR
jgi:chemotaxis protein CheD